MKIIVLNLLLSIIAGWISFYFSEITIAIGFAFVVFLSLELLTIQLFIEKQTSNQKTVSNFLNSLKINDSYSEIYMLYSLRNFNFAYKDTIKLEKNMVFDAWRECMFRCHNRWSTFHYVAPNTSYDSGWGNSLAKTTQEEKIKAGVVIERIFVVQDNNELKKLEKIINEQREMEIKIGSIFYDALMANSIIKDAINSIGTVDITVIDGKWCFLLPLDNKRHFTSAIITRDENKLHLAKLAILEAWGMLNNDIRN